MIEYHLLAIRSSPDVRLVKILLEEAQNMLNKGIDPVVLIQNPNLGDFGISDELREVYDLIILNPESNIK